MSKKIIIATYLLIAAVIFNSSVVFASSKNYTYIKVLKTNPVNNQTNINIDSILTIKFSGKILKGKEYNKIGLNSAKKNNKITITFNADTLNIKSQSQMDFNTKYTLTIPIGAIKDSRGNSLSKNYTLQFTTATDKLTNVKMVDVGYENSAAVKTDGTVWVWGENYSGQLGDDTNITKIKPVQVKGISNVKMITAGAWCMSVLKSDGTVWTWGANDMDGKKYKPIQIKGLTNVKMISAGVYSTAALKNDGTVWVWDGLGTSEANDGSVYFSTPRQVEGLDNVKSISAGGYFISALKSDGTVWEWGENEHGQLGDGTLDDRNTPVEVEGVNNVKMISAGHDNMTALKTDGTVWVWGFNEEGRLGLGEGTAESITTPIKLAGIDSVKVIAAGNAFSVALRNDDTIWAWGCNDFGLFDKKFPSVITMPVEVSDIKNIINISAGTFHYTFLKSDGTIHEFGWDYSESIG
jgi:alpha-tubulin suppressor-like RCC1 family protein